MAKNYLVLSELICSKSRPEKLNIEEAVWIAVGSKNIWTHFPNVGFCLNSVGKAEFSEKLFAF